jgi:hypothetical protein
VQKAVEKVAGKHNQGIALAETLRYLTASPGASPCGSAGEASFCWGMV